MTRRELLLMLTSLGMSAASGGLLAGCGLGSPGATPSRKLPRVGLLADTSDQIDPFVQGLREAGYVEGKNIGFQYRYGGITSSQQRISELATELVSVSVDVIYAAGDRLTTAAKGATSRIPIVFGTSADPVGLGFVETLAHPGGNLTGLSNGGAEWGGKGLELASQVAPGVSQVGVLVNPDNLVSAASTKRTEAAGQALSIGVQRFEWRRPEDFEGAFQMAVDAKLPVLLISSFGTTASIDQQLRDLALKYRLPTIGSGHGFIIGYSANVADNRRRAAGYVDRILRGAKPADLPVEGPTKFDFIVNLRLAQTIGLSLPPALLAQATEVIQ